jgi:amino acid efflux transporter
MTARATEGGSLSVVQGTALTVAAVLGTGVISLPALAIDAAGPASLLAWAALLVISVPLAATFAALGARHPACCSSPSSSRSRGSTPTT